MARKALSKKIRFEVFKRDSFTCQYCGLSAPDTILNVDHIHPVVQGGSNDILNLVTSCFDCNSGKGARKLSDSTVVKKQIDQMKEMQERREQLELLAQWRSQMTDLTEQKIETISRAINKEMESANRVVTDSYRNDIRIMVKKYPMDEIWEAVEKASAQYLRDPNDQEDRDKFLSYIPRICYWQKRERENPVEAELRKMAYTAVRLWWRCEPRSLSHRLIELRSKYDIPKETLLRIITSSSGITQFEEGIQELFDSEDDNG